MSLLHKQKNDISSLLSFTQEQCQQILQNLSKTAKAKHVGNASTHDELSGKAFYVYTNGKKAT